MRQYGKWDERGFTHLLLIGALAIVVVVAFAGWLVFGHHTPAKSTGGSSSNSAYNSCMRINHDSRLCQFAAHYVQLNKTAYQATVVVTSSQGTVSDLTYSSDGKGNSEVNGTSDGQQLSSIELAGATYIKVSGSGWIEYPANAANAPAQTNPTASMNVAVGQSNLSFQYATTESCGSLTCYKYLVSDHSQPNATQNMWFDTASYKLRKWSYQDTATGSTDMAINYQPVTITAPSPVKLIPSSN